MLEYFGFYASDPELDDPELAGSEPDAPAVDDPEHARALARAARLGDRSRPSPSPGPGGTAWEPSSPRER